MKDFKIRFLQDFYGIKKGEVITFHNGIFTYPDGSTSVQCNSPEQFVSNNPDIKLEIVKESKMFTKDDLKVNDWCVQADGEVMRLVQPDGEFVLIGEHSYCDLHEFKDDLTFPGETRLNIDKVFRPETGFSYQLIRDSYKDGKLVFDRGNGIDHESSPKFKIGDSVKICDTGKIFSTYDSFLPRVANLFTHNFIRGAQPISGETFEIVASGKHDHPCYDTVFAIQDKTTLQVFLIGEEGLEKAE